MVTKQSIFAAYNKAIACGQFERGRINRALGIALSASTKIVNGQIDVVSTTKQGDWHLATWNKCDCQDAKRGHKCKHQIAWAILYRAYQYEVKQ